ncbi:protein NUCLEOLAR COMPLEX ASSOCIATED 4 isoform X2 [Malania oleifera]|uniref:protein NUCLEOLAR COMPLEX ASSOCIATED 4 isoform X2 n=1 Tax=Malania oleifera TaxID=397392 RepID=UPI0025AECB49|nr:protein NUCLEOLAR COMPLEX ASSOCIATED 4 isoform X2 [Malania oleifera]
MASTPAKKRKGKYSLSELKTLGHQLLSSRSHINNLPLLLSFISPSSPPHYALESLLSLQSFFTPLLPQLPPSSSSSSKPSARQNSAEDPEFIYWTWLRSKFDNFVQSLIDVAVSPKSEDALRDVVLDTIMESVKLGNGGRFQSAIYHKFIHRIVHSSLVVDFLLESLTSKYFKFLDVRYFTYISLEKLSRTLETKDISEKRIMSLDGDGESQSKESMELSIQKLHYILLHIPPLEASDDHSCHEMWSGSGFSSNEGDSKDHSQPMESKVEQGKTKKSNNNVLSSVNIAKKIKLKFTKAWISFLRLPLPLDVYKEVLVSLDQVVIPHLSNPIMLCDFLTRSYDIGGVISVMALSSLFVLMTQHGLEYPNFYEKLYALLVPSIFMAKHRAKFFQLLDSCLKSPLLPAYLAAAFAKKLSRLTLSVPPSGALIIVALIHNLLRRHPSINCLVHREDGDGITKDESRAQKGFGDNADNFVSSTQMDSGKSGIDPFKDEESNPMKCNAMRSSLWEIDTLRHHYCPPVSRFVLSLENDLTVRAKTTEVAVTDFSSGSYATIFREEIRRRVKQVPLAFYKSTPTSLFSGSDFAGWGFRYEDEEDQNCGDGENTTNSISKEHDQNSAKRPRQQKLSSPSPLS